MLVREPTPEHFVQVRNVAENDESVDVRFFARKALEVIRRALPKELREKRPKKIDLRKANVLLKGTGEQKSSLIGYAVKFRLLETVPVLIHHLKTEADVTIIAEIVKAVGFLGGEETLRSLIPFLGHEDGRVRANAIEGIAATGSTKGFPFILRKIGDSDNRVRGNVLKVMKTVPRLNILRLLKDMLGSPYFSMQASAAFVMKSFPDEDNASLLEPLGGSSDPAVRRNARLALRSMADTGIAKAREILSRYSREEPEEKRGIRAFSREVASGTSPSISDRLKRNEGTLESLENQIRDIDQARTALASMLENPDPDTRIHAIQTLTKDGNSFLAPQLCQQLGKEKDVGVLAKILITLGRMQFQKALPDFKRCLGNPDARCRANAVEAVRLLGNKDALKEIPPLLLDSNNRVKANAILALQHERQIDLKKPLEEMVSSADILMQLSAIFVISWLEENQYFPFLKRLTGSSFPAVREKALGEWTRLEKGGFLQVPSPGVPAPNIPCPDCQSPMAEFADPETQEALWFCLKCGRPAPITRIIHAEAGSFVHLGNLPGILAIPLKEYIGEGRPVNKMWCMVDVIEVMIRFLVVIGVADCRRSGALPPQMLEEFRNRIERPFLGKWLGMVISVKNHLGPDSWIPGLKNFLERDFIPFLDKTGTNFLEIRNQLAHGGGMTRGAAERELRDWQPRFESLMGKGERVLHGFSLLVRVSPDSLGILQGPDPKPQPYSGGNSLGQEHPGKDQAVVLVGPWGPLPLWPLTLYGIPRSFDDRCPAFKPAPQIYSRTASSRDLEMRPVGSGELGRCLSDAKEEGLKEFLKIFGLNLPRHAEEPLTFSYEQELLDDAGRLVGRKEELAELDRNLAATENGVIWVRGKPGIGKSYFIAKIAQDQMEKHKPRKEQEIPETLVVPFRFRSQESHLCTRGAFLAFTYERLVKHFGNREEKDELARTLGKSPGELWLATKKFLKKAGHRKILFILDGLDELYWRDKTFVQEVIFDVSGPGRIPEKSEPGPGIIWLCSGRPEGYKDEVSLATCRVIKDLGPMLKEDIGEILRKELSEKDRQKILQFDSEEDDGKGGKRTRNSFVENVQKCSGGFPMYIHFLVHDISQNIIRPSETGSELPTGLDKYYESMIGRHSLGEEMPIRTAIAAHLAIAREPLNEEELGALLLERKRFIPPGKDPVQLVKNGLAALQSWIRLAPKPGGGEGFAMFHLSLREYLLTAASMRQAIRTARKALGDLVGRPELWNGKAGFYLLRWGIRHLIDEKRWGEIEHLLLNLLFLEEKAQAGMVESLCEDFQIVCPPGEGIQESWQKPRKHQGHFGLFCPGCRAWFRMAGVPASEGEGFAVAGIPPEKCPHCQREIRVTPGFVSGEWQVSPPPPTSEIMLEQEFVRPLFPRRKFIELIGVALARTRVFLSDHPRSLFQCLWNLCWWHDAPETAGHCHVERQEVGSGQEPWAIPGPKVSGLLQEWRGQKEKRVSRELQDKPGFLDKLLVEPDLDMASTPGGKIRVKEGKFGADLLADTGKVDALVKKGEGQDLSPYFWARSLRPPAEMLEGPLAWEAREHQANVWSLDRSFQNSQCFLSSSWDGTVREWSATSGSSKEFYRSDRVLEESPVMAVHFLPDGKRVALGNGQTVRIINLLSRREETSFPGNALNIVHLDSSIPGKKLVSCGYDDFLRVFDGGSFTQERQIPTGHQRICAMQCSGRLPQVVTGGADGSIRIWDLASGEKVGEFDGAHSGNVSFVQFDPTERFLVSGGENEGRVCVWNLTSKKREYLIIVRTCPSSVDFFPDGSRFVVGCGRVDLSFSWKLAFFRFGENRPYKEFESAQGAVLAVRVSPDGTKVFSGHGNGAVCCWNAEAKARSASSFHGLMPVTHLQFSKDGEQFCSGGGAAEKAFRSKTEWVPCAQGFFCKPLDPLNGYFLWDTGRPAPPGIFHGHTDYLSHVEFSPDGRFLLSSSWDENIHIRDVETGELVYVISGTKRTNMATLSADQKWLLLVNGTLTLTQGQYDAIRENTKKIHGDDVYSQEFLEKFNFGEVRNFRSGKTVKKIPTPEEGWRSGAISPEGDRIASVSFFQKVPGVGLLSHCFVRIRDAESGNEIASLWHYWPVSRVEFSPSGRYLVSIGAITVFWDLETMEIVKMEKGILDPKTAFLRGCQVIGRDCSCIKASSGDILAFLPEAPDCVANHPRLPMFALGEGPQVSLVKLECFSSGWRGFPERKISDPSGVQRVDISPQAILEECRDAMDTFNRVGLKVWKKHPLEAAKELELFFAALETKEAQILLNHPPVRFGAGDLLFWICNDLWMNKDFKVIESLLEKVRALFGDFNWLYFRGCLEEVRVDQDIPRAMDYFRLAIQMAAYYGNVDPDRLFPCVQKYFVEMAAIGRERELPPFLEFVETFFPWREKHLEFFPTFRKEIFRQDSRIRPEGNHPPTPTEYLGASRAFQALTGLPLKISSATGSLGHPGEEVPVFFFKDRPGQRLYALLGKPGWVEIFETTGEISEFYSKGLKQVTKVWSDEKTPQVNNSIVALFGLYELLEECNILHRAPVDLSGLKNLSLGFVCEIQEVATDIRRKVFNSSVGRIISHSRKVGEIVEIVVEIVDKKCFISRSIIIGKELLSLDFAPSLPF